MRRREFIKVIGGATATAWPLAARAQQADRVRRIGALMTQAADDPEGQSRLLALAQGLQESGWTIGRNVRIDTRWGAGDAERYRRYAAELVALAPDVILVNGPAALAQLQQATRSLPIVFTNVTDPVGAGFVVSVARPGGNATGFMLSEYSTSGKWLQLLKEIAPRVTRAAIIRDPTLTSSVAQFAAIQSAAASLGVELSPIDMRNPGEIERSIAAFARHARAASYPLPSSGASIVPAQTSTLIGAETGIKPLPQCTANVGDGSFTALSGWAARPSMSAAPPIATGNSRRCCLS
jgi:putative ABC transport system substrate-binding protein